MNMHPITRPDGKIGDIRVRRSALRQITATQLLQLGTHQVAYLKSGMHNGDWLFVLHGADGEPLAVADTIEAAVEMAAEHGLSFVSVH